MPNREIQSSLNQLFINYLTDQAVESLASKNQIFQAINADVSQLENVLVSLFASIPYNNYANKVIER